MLRIGVCFMRLYDKIDIYGDFKGTALLTFFEAEVSAATCGPKGLGAVMAVFPLKLCFTEGFLLVAYPFWTYGFYFTNREAINLSGDFGWTEIDLLLFLILNSKTLFFNYGYKLLETYFFLTGVVYLLRLKFLVLLWAFVLCLSFL